MSKVGFTFYPKDWWTSDTFYAFDAFERYIYLELLFMMYANEGRVQNDKSGVERRLGIEIDVYVWIKITERLVIEDGFLTHPSVNKRLKKGKNPYGKPSKSSQEDQEALKKALAVRAKVFYGTVAQYKDKYPKQTLREFYNYWTEPNKTLTKMRFEIEETWELGRRLSRWARNNKEFSSQQPDGQLSEMAMKMKAAEKRQLHEKD